MTTIYSVPGRLLPSDKGADTGGALTEERLLNLVLPPCAFVLFQTNLFIRLRKTESSNPHLDTGLSHPFNVPRKGRSSIPKVVSSFESVTIVTRGMTVLIADVMSLRSIWVVSRGILS